MIILSNIAFHSQHLNIKISKHTKKFKEFYRDHTDSTIIFYSPCFITNLSILLSIC